MINLHAVVGALRALLAPPFCFYCRDYIYQHGPRLSDSFICASCCQLIKPIISTRIGLGAQYGMRVHAVSAYEEPLKSLILAKGWSDYTASKQLARIMWDYSMVKHIPFDYVVPLPSHWTRIARRGYNQAEVIAQEIATLSGKPLLAALKRVRRTKRQSTCTVTERTKNVKEAFALASGSSCISGGVVLLVDDLMTTGSTLCAAGRELIRANPKELYALVACRVI